MSEKVVHFAIKKQNGDLWSVTEMLRSASEEIESGERSCDGAVLLTFKRDKEGKINSLTFTQSHSDLLEFPVLGAFLNKVWVQEFFGESDDD